MTIRASGGLLRELATATVDNRRDTRIASDANQTLAIDARQRELNEQDAAAAADQVQRTVGIVMQGVSLAQTTVSQGRKAGEAVNDLNARPPFEANMTAAAGEVRANTGTTGAVGSEAHLDQVMETRLGGEDANRVGDVFSRDQVRALLGGERLTDQQLRSLNFTDAQRTAILEKQNTLGRGLNATEAAEFVWDNRGRSQSQAAGDQAERVTNAFTTTISAGTNAALGLGGENHRRGMREQARERDVADKSAGVLAESALKDTQQLQEIGLALINRNRQTQA